MVRRMGLTLGLLLGLTGCAQAGVLKFSFTPPGFDNGAVCPASADTIQATTPVDALMSWTGPVSGSDSLFTLPRLVTQTVTRPGMPPGAYSVKIVLRDAGGLSCDAIKVIVVKGPPSKAAFN